MHSFRYEKLQENNVGDIVNLDPAESNHLFRILRAEHGMQILLMNGQGVIAEAVVEKNRNIRIRDMRVFSKPEISLTLFFAPPRKQKNDMILKAAAELGISKIQPVFCERSVSSPDDNSIEGRWNDLLFEACKQSRNPFLPKVSPMISFSDAVKTAADSCETVFYGSPYTGSRTNQSVNPSKIGLFIGPEGGFSDHENEKMIIAGFTPLRIGNWVLRVETAAIAAMAILMNTFTKH